MKQITKINRGLNVPIDGAPEQVISQGPSIRAVAVLGFDYIGMKPTMEVSVGDKVKKGQCLFTDKKNEGVRYTAPAGGTISAINRGAKRVFQSVVIDVEGDEAESFPSWTVDQLPTLETKEVQEVLVNSGLWTALRTRPFSKVPALDTQPAAIFVTAMDTNPLSANPEVIIAESKTEFQNGLQVLSQLTEGKVYTCRAAQASIPALEGGAFVTAEFSGPHPAGLVGTHIHCLEPVGLNKTVWHIGYQDVIAIGHLFTTGQLNTQRVVALGGPSLDKPRLVRTLIGASTDEITAGQLSDGEHRVISGSVLSGRTAKGPVAFLGRYHNQISVIPEAGEREFMGWASPGFKKHSFMGIYISSLFGKKTFPMTTTSNGSARAIVPIGAYEGVMPLDILPTQLLRALVVGDLEVAEKLGALELDEEDLALCTYVSPSKYEYGPILRDNLARIEAEG